MTPLDDLETAFAFLRDRAWDAADRHDAALARLTDANPDSATILEELADAAWRVDEMTRAFYDIERLFMLLRNEAAHYPALTGEPANRARLMNFPNPQPAPTAPANKKTAK